MRPPARSSSFCRPASDHRRPSRDSSQTCGSPCDASVLTPLKPSRKRKRSLLLLSILWLGCLLTPLQAKDRWTELNIGPYVVDTRGDMSTARSVLTQVEQLRWVLGNLLESQDLKSVWPIRIILTQNSDTNPTIRTQFVSQNGEEAPQFVSQNGQYLLVCSPDEPLPLGEIAGILLDANTPRLPPEVEHGLRQLFSTIQSHGTHVTWGSAPARPDLAWARMQLFATKFEYSLSFHIFLASLRDGSTVTTAEQNAFAKPAKELEAEAAANLAAGHWDAVSVSGRPLDPKRDFGEHAVDPEVIDVYLAEADLSADPDAAEKAYKAAIATGVPANAALGYAGLAQLAKRRHQPYKPYLDDAISVGSRRASVYLEKADGLSGDQAAELLKKAALYNPRWAEPVYRQAQLAVKPADKVALLHNCTQLDPRRTDCWLQLAQLQSTMGDGPGAQGSWFRAEQSAPTDSQRDRIHTMRLASEEQRLNAVEAKRRQEQQAAEADEDRALRAEAARIHAAERRANRELAAESGAPVPANPATANQFTAKAKKLTGTLVAIGCSNSSSATLSVRDRRGETTKVLLGDKSQLDLSCGVQRPPLPISLTYSEHPDDQLGTAGQVVTLNLQ